MNIFTFKNSSINTIDSISSRTSKIINTNTQINTINVDTPIFVLSGEFNTQINILNDCLLDLDANFLPLNSIINLINTDVIQKNIIIAGVINNFNSNLEINSDNNIILNLAISTKTLPLNTINIHLNSVKNSNESFILNSIKTDNPNKPKINLQSTNTQNIIINSDLNTFDVGLSNDMNLRVSEKSNIENFYNIKQETFKSVIASEIIIKAIENSSFITVPLTALLFKVTIKNGKGKILIPVNRDVQNFPSTNVILNSEYYPIL